jgi:hypothetical protein
LLLILQAAYLNTGARIDGARAGLIERSQKAGAFSPVDQSHVP